MNKWMKTLCLLLLGILLIGCGSSHGEQGKKELETGFIPARAGMYDSTDTAMIKKIDKHQQTITFYNLVKGKNYTLSFDGTTRLLDKYGGAVSMEQMDEGDIVEIAFLKAKKMVASMQKSDTSFYLEEVTNFTIDERKKEMVIGNSTYRFEDDLFIFSGGEQVEVMDINQVDTLRVQGMDHTVYSICIDKGHGYLRLKNDAYFLGGWIEVGNTIIQPVREDMLLVVPEGKYDVLLSAKGLSGSKRVTIKRDKETELDIGDLRKKEDPSKYGNLIFAVSPDTASVYIDGDEVDISAPVQAEYGIHQLMAKADGYQTVIKYIKVGQENATIQITMETADGNTVSSNSAGTSSGEDVASTGSGKLTIDAPAGVEVYVDGSYIGITPCSFKKSLGVHVITLRKDGYVTKSYTINVVDADSNENMSFSALVKEEEKDTEEEEESTTEYESIVDWSSEEETETGTDEESIEETESTFEEETKSNAKD